MMRKQLSAIQTSCLHPRLACRRLINQPHVTAAGQAQALRHGISRALQLFESGYRPALKAAGLLTRDSRIVERKKPGLAKARKSFQWVKR